MSANQKHAPHTAQAAAAAAAAAATAAYDCHVGKHISYLLRHGAHANGLDIRTDGFVRVPALMAVLNQTLARTPPRRPETRATHTNPSRRRRRRRQSAPRRRSRRPNHALPHHHHRPPVTLAVIRRIVRENKKQRFALTHSAADGWWIRASQGHSLTTVKSADLLKRVTRASQCGECVHGTTRAAWGLIEHTGLSRMGRNHIHMALHPPTGSNGNSNRSSNSSTEVVSGARQSSEVFVYVDAQQLLDAGIPVYLSANGVVLCDGDADGRIAPRFFKRVDVGGGSGGDDANSAARPVRSKSSKPSK
jgi:RNA:NAD 2'-phosphotransferase (TPT1/KptA family)